MHAYRDRDRPGTVEVEAHRPNGYLCVDVRDDRKLAGLTPRVDSPGLGLGLPLISQAAASVEVRHAAAGGTELVMRFNLVG